MSNRDRDVAHLYHESTRLCPRALQRQPPAYHLQRGDGCSGQGFATRLGDSLEVSNAHPAPPSRWTCRGHLWYGPRRPPLWQIVSLLPSYGQNICTVEV
jgi:hypothetical protein